MWSPLTAEKLQNHRIYSIVTMSLTCFDLSSLQYRVIIQESAQPWVGYSISTSHDTSESLVIFDPVVSITYSYVNIRTRSRAFAITRSIELQELNGFYLKHALVQICVRFYLFWGRFETIRDIR